MIRVMMFMGCAVLLMSHGLFAQAKLEKDIIPTSMGNLEITFIGHGSLMMTCAGTTIHIDPYGRLTDYGKLPGATLILVTHQHPDHLDLNAIKAVRTAKTKILMPEACAGQLSDGTVMKNGDVQTLSGVKIEAVPAYNLVHKRPDGNPYHARGEGNGYILTFGRTRVYVAGDTENTPEMKALKEIDVAFLPMNLPYTMTPEMVADAARAFTPKVLYPYHFGDTDPAKLVGLLKDVKGVEVRVRNMK